MIWGGSHIALTTTNLRGLVGQYEWIHDGSDGAPAITSIRLAPVTAARKLRANGVFTLYALKTKERFGRDAFYPDILA